MATPSQSRAVKSLNTSGGRKRFVFKSFSQRIEEIDIGEKVFRSLDTVKAEPSSGSSFFRDCLIEYRELNTAEDFISFYEEMMPWVQTLPQVLLHKDTIMAKLLSRLQVTARLSLEPILRLIAALSRDLLIDFLPFLKKFADALVNLLENGAEREPEVLEQIFTSWSYIMMHLKKYLILDITALLKITRHLRYYPRDYVEEFMAESISFLLRNAPDTQLRKGIMEIMQEVGKKPSHVRKSGASALLWYIMKGSSSKFHSRADRVLRLLMSSCIIDIGVHGVEVVTGTLGRLCEELHPIELKLMWNCLFDEISISVNMGSLLHLSHILSLVISSIQFCNREKNFDYQPMLDVVKLLVQKYIRPDNKTDEDQFNEIVKKLLQWMLCVVAGVVSPSGPSAISGLLSDWAPVFELRNKNLLTFIRGLVQKDTCVCDAFRDHILSAINHLAEVSPPEEIVYVMMTFFEKLRASCRGFDGLSEERFPVIYSLLRKPITDLIKDIACEDLSSMHYSESKLAGLWGILSCYPYLSSSEATPYLIMELVNAINQLPINEVEKVAGVSSCTWQSLLGAAVASYHKLQLSDKSTLAREMSTFLNLAQKFKSSSNILFAVAELLDSVHGYRGEADSIQKMIHPELKADKSVKAITIFADNVGLPDNVIRISTLRILCNYESLEGCPSEGDEPAQKKLKTESGCPFKKDAECNNVVQILLSIEMTPLSITTSNKIILLISQVQMALSTGRIAEDYIPLLMNGIISIFHKRFSQLWIAAQECLAILLDKYVGLVWDKFVSYLEQSQLQFLTSDSQLESMHAELPNNSSDLLNCFNAYLSPSTDSTPCATVVSWLLRSLQKIQSIAESKSRRLVPLFLTFLGYSDVSMRDSNVGSYVVHPCKGKEWRGVLKEWLNLLVLMRNPKSLYRSQFLKEVLIKRLLDQTDTEIQVLVLDCLLNWKDDFLLPYGQHLRNLITSKKLREELAIWTLSKESHRIEDLHREYIIPIVIRLLLPKVRNLKTLGSRKHASVHHRRAILCFMAQLENKELLLFFVLLIKPLQSTSNGAEDLSKWFWSSCEISLEEFQACEVLKHFSSDKLAEISWKKRYGFLHLFEDIFKSFDELHLKPFLNLFMGLAVRILESCMLDLDGCKWNGSSEPSYLPNGNATTHKAEDEILTTATTIKQLKDQRSLCLKIISLVLDKFAHHDFGCSFWDVFFTSVKNLIEGFKQEGASSEKPSSLFSCFLAMSRSHTLVPLLLRERSLVPTVFSVLTVKSASDAITVSVLAFIENLLNLDSDVENHQDLAIKDVLLPNLSPLIDSLHCYFQIHGDSRRKAVKWPGKVELRIFKLLSNYINESVDASKFVDILLPFLSKKAHNSDDCLEVLRVIQVILPRVGGTGSSEKILNAIAHLLISAGLDIRLSICDLLDSLAISDPSVASLAKLVRELNAVSVSELDELDYDTRVNAYEKFDYKFFSTLREDHAIVIMSQSVYDMSSEELILRQSAYRLFLAFVHFSSLVLDCEGKSRHDMPDPMIVVEADACWTKACIHRLVKKFFLKYMGESMNKGISVQREWISLLREMVLKIPQMPFLNSIKELCSKDPEVDFFNNILHLQIHRRAKALARFRKAIAAGDFSEIITKKVFVPLFFKMLFDVQDGKREHLRNACLQSLASISGHMQWESYHAFLLRCFREMILKPDQQKILLRLICHVLDHFHFTEASVNQEADDNINEIINPGANEMCSSTTLHATRTFSSSEIQAHLQKTVLPKIQKLLSSESDKVNVIINLAALKLLKLLPVDTMESQLPSIIHRICNFLKNHMVSIRDEAREALVVCSKELGLEYLHFIVNVLRATLKRGYQMHVLGYTLNFILSKALRSPSTGKLDYCLEELLCIAENDILGDVSEEKEVEKIASKMKETKFPKSFGTLKLIAQNVTFRTHASKLLSPVKSHLHKHLTPKLKAKLEKMLKHIAEGIECNLSVCHTDLFVFVYGLIEDGIMEENPEGRESSTTKSNKHGKTGLTEKINPSPWLIGYKSQSSHLVTVFALRLLHNRLKSMQLDKKDEQLLCMLDPFVELLGHCLRSKFEDILSAALGCLRPLIRLPLPAFRTHTDNIKMLLLDIAQKSGNASSSLLQHCLSLLTVLLQSSEVTLSTDQLHMMIQFPIFVDLERNPSSDALKLLKAIIGRKLVIPEIFDIVNRVAELMVTTQVEPIRKKSSQILLSFLLHYPLSHKRLEQHLGFLLSNLRYEHTTGREAVLEMLHAIIVKSSKNIDDEQARTIFLHFVVCLANDQDSKVRSLVGAALKLLIGRTSQSALSSILGDSLSWYVGENQNLWSAAAQVLGLLVEVLKKGFSRHIVTVVPVLKRILRSSLDIVEGEQPKYSDEALNPFWKKAYYSLVLLEKLLHQFPELYFAKDMEDIWNSICEFLLSRHMWIRNISSRLVFSYFAAVSEGSSANSEKLKLYLLMKPSRLFSIAVSLCGQLKAQLTDDEASRLITQNLVFVICRVHSLLGQSEFMSLQEFWSALEMHEQGHFVKAFQLLGSRKGAIMLASLSGEKVQNVGDSVNDLHSLLVSPLLKRLGKVALQTGDIQMKIVFDCFRTISSQIGQEGCQQYAFNMLFPLYKVCEGFAGKVISDDVKQLAVVVRNGIRDILGAENFVKVYNEIRKVLKAKRDKRKQQEKVMAVVNPERNAKRKLRNAAKHRAHKKRKIMTMKKWKL